MPMIVCIKCQKFFHPHKNGVVFEEGMPSHSIYHLKSVLDPDAFENAQAWKPYKLWRADELACPKCDARIIAGVARDNFAEHYEPDYEEIKRRLGPDGIRVFVKDCI